MQFRVIVGQELTLKQMRAIENSISSTFKTINAVFNKWNPSSELSHLNHLKAGVESPLSPLLEHILLETDSLVKLSEGRFDPTIEPLQKLWKQNLQRDAVPSPNDIKLIGKAIGWDKIHIHGGIFYKDDDLTQLDLGGIAKGYGIDLIIEKLKGQGFDNLYVEWGGEIRTVGNHPHGRPWTIYISRLGESNPDHALKILELKNQAIATSGDYLQNWTFKVISADKKEKTATFFHIFDPFTLHPLESTYFSIASASVIAPTCALADGLATTVMLFPSLEEAENWTHRITEKIPGVSFFLFSRESLNYINK